jgi:ATP-dependent helicase/nuclease subunit A
VLGDPALAPLFAAAAWVEQPVVGTWQGRRIAGQVDRMAVVGGALWLADFKSGRPPPAGAPMPAAYARQLAAYTALLAPLFAELDIRAHLIWTETGAVQVLDKAALEVHMRDACD